MNASGKAVYISRVVNIPREMALNLPFLQGFRTLKDLQRAANQVQASRDESLDRLALAAASGQGLHVLQGFLDRRLDLDNRGGIQGGPLLCEAALHRQCGDGLCVVLVVDKV